MTQKVTACLINFNLDPILFEGNLFKFSFNDMEAFTLRYVVVTSDSVRVFESETQARSLYSKPLLAVPLTAIEKVGRVYFGDRNDDHRLRESSAAQGR